MKQRQVWAGVAIAATATLGMTLPASAARPAAVAPAVATPAASCAVSVPNLRVLAVGKAVANLRVQLKTNCRLKAPLTLYVTAVGGKQHLGALVFPGSHGVVSNKAFGVFHVVAKNYQAGHVYATAGGRFVAVALGQTKFTTVKVDKATKTLHTTGQETVFSFAKNTVIKRGGPTVGYYREGTKGAFRRDTMDAKIKNSSGGRVSWVVPIRCGYWQYRMVQPATKTFVGVTANYAYTNRVC